MVSFPFVRDLPNNPGYSLIAGEMNVKNLNRIHGQCAAAAVAVAFVALSANAAIIYSGPLNWVVPGGDGNTTGLSVNFETGDHGATGVVGTDITLWGNGGSHIQTQSPSGFNPYMANPFLNSNGFTRIGIGTQIGSAGTFFGANDANLFVDTTGSSPTQPYSTTWLGYWQPNAQSYLGVKFQDANLATHYGWVQIAIGADAMTRSIVDYAYNSNADQLIFAGATPAPGALALLGLAGFVRGRRRA